MSFSKAGLYMTEVVGSLLNGRSEDPEVDAYNALVLAKGLCILVMIISTSICGYLPFILDRWFDLRNSKPNSNTGKGLRFLLYFGGGCLICITFQHIIVEVSEDVKSLQASGKLAETPFDLTLFLMCIGFMAMFLIEELIHMYMHSHEHQMDSSRSTENSEIPSEEWEPKRQALVDVHLPPTGHDDESILISSLRGLLVVLALSIHALFEGLAVGLQTTPDRVWTVTGAVSGHKLVLAFCIGIELIAAKVKLWLALVYTFVFVVVAPIGVAVGIGLASDEGAEVPQVIIQGLASGTLLYVAFFEILFKARSGLWTYAGFVLGFFAIFGIIVGTHSLE